MQKHTSHQAGWKYTVSALALSVALAPVAQAAELIATKTKELAGREYTFQKWMDSRGNTTSVILDEMGNAVLESALPEITQNIPSMPSVIGVATYPGLIVHTCAPQSPSRLRSAAR